MAVCEVVLVPDSRLKQRCAEVKSFDEQLRVIVANLEDTRCENKGCVGIAAPQIGVLIRVAIVDTSGHKKYGAKSSGHRVLINPIIIRQDGQRLGREGCLSLPDFTANVRRAQNIEVEYSDAAGNSQTFVCEDFEAVVMQHEIDHLDGVLFLDRVANLATDVFPRKKK